MELEVLAQFVSQEDSPLGSIIHLPRQLTLESLRMLLPPGIEDRDRMRMFVFGNEIHTTLADALKTHTVTNEETVKIYCYPDDPPQKSRAPGYLASSCSGHKEAILCVKISPCGKYICSSSGDGTVRFWCGVTKSPIKSVFLHNHWIQSIAFSPNSKYVAAGAMNGGVSLIDVASMTVVYSKKLHKNGVTAIAWRNNSAEFASASRDSSVGVWGVSGHMRNVFHEKPVICVGYFGEYLLSGGRNCQIKVTNSQGEVVQTLRGHTHWVTGLTVHSGQDMKKFSGENASIDIDLGSGKSYFVSISDDKTGILWRPVWDENGKWSFSAAKRLAGHKDVLTSVSIACSGIYIATSSFDRTVRLWNSMNGFQVHVFKSHTSLAYQTMFSKSGNLLVSCSADKTVKVHSVEKKKLLSDFVCKDQVFALDIKDSMIVSGGKDKLVYFFA
ncbi:ribosome assembly protein 4 [Nematocida sp. AWRm77]|nr:ribosome assembly protein 4 [Nematocida sp. AWRm77]